MTKVRRRSTISAPLVSALVVLALAAMSACAPPELLQAQDAVADGGGDPLADVGNDVSPAPTFGQIADLVRGSCSATPSCHGESGFTNFSVEGNGAATDAQVQAALEDVTTLDGIDLVTPGDTEVSALYLRLIDTGSRKMPPAGQPELNDDEIEMVRVWIEEGASYE